MLCQGQGHGGVAVVAAGVHDAGMDRGPGKAGGLLHRQGVHIRPEGHSLRLSGVEEGADRAGDGLGERAGKGGENGENIGHSFRQLVRELRDLVQGPAVDNGGWEHGKSLLGIIKDGDIVPCPAASA